MIQDDAEQASYENTLASGCDSFINYQKMKPNIYVIHNPKILQTLTDLNQTNLHIEIFEGKNPN